MSETSNKDRYIQLLSELKMLCENEMALSPALPSESYCDMTSCGNLYTHVIYSDEEKRKAIRVMADLGKSGTCPKSHLSNICELLTGILNYCKDDNKDKIYIMAAGHKCGVATTCHDVIMRRLLAISARERR